MEEVGGLYECDDCGCETTSINVIRSEQLCGYCLEKIHPLIVKRFLEKKDFAIMEKQTEKGILKYRMPNVLEVYDLLDLSGVNNGVSETLKVKRNVIQHMSALIDFSEIEDVKSYEDLLNIPEVVMIPLSDIADEVISKIFEVFKKKN